MGAGVAGADRLQPVCGERRAQGRTRRRGAVRCAAISSPSRATKEILAGRNRLSESRQGALTSGMPQASASNTRMVGMPGRRST